MKFYRSLFVLLFIFSLGLSACAAKSSGSADEASQYAVVPSAPQEEASPGFSGETQNNVYTDSTTAEVERVVIKDARLEIIADDPAAVLNAIEGMADDSGGFIVSSNLYKVQTSQGLEVPGADITVRVPAEMLSQIMDQIKNLLQDIDKDVQYENIAGQDVTSEYTDLQSRLRNLEDAQQQLQEIMDNAVRTEDVLSVYNQLTQVNEQIEVLKGRIQYFDEAARLSSLAVKITARAGIQELSIGGWEPAGVARNAIQALIDTLQFLGNATIWIVLYLLPTALCILIPLFVFYLIIRAINRRRKAQKLARTAASDSSNS